MGSRPLVASKWFQVSGVRKQMTEVWDRQKVDTSEIPHKKLDPHSLPKVLLVFCPPINKIDGTWHHAPP